MVTSPRSPAHDVICETIERYQKTFSANDRDGWLALWADDGVLEDPVGSAPRRGRAALEAFWDEIHAGDTHGTVAMVQGPQVCGLEAAWAFALTLPAGTKTVTVPIIDFGEFTEDGRICHVRAFWSEASVTVSS
jgi:steroid delta-isomerase